MSDYKRFPIILDNHTCLICHLFTRVDDIEDIWMYDYILDKIENPYKDGAEQFLNQLEDHWTPAFLMELRNAITEKLRQHDKEYGANFAEESKFKKLQSALLEYFNEYEIHPYQAGIDDIYPVAELKINAKKNKWIINDGR